MASNSITSDSGFCFVGSQDFQPGERLMLQLVKDGDVQSLLCARTKWVKKRGNDYVLGCEFIHRSGHNSLQPFIKVKPAVESAPEKIEKRRYDWVWWSAGSAAAMIWALLQFGM